MPAKRVGLEPEALPAPAPSAAVRAVAIEATVVPRFTVADNVQVGAKNLIGLVANQEESQFVRPPSFVGRDDAGVGSAGTASLAMDPGIPTQLFKGAQADVRVELGDVADNPNSRRIIYDATVSEAQSKTLLAEQLGRSDLFSRRNGARPYKLTLRRTGTLVESNFDALYHDPKPETQAVLRIIRPQRGSSRALDAAASGQSFEVLCETSEFLLQSAQEPDSEKFQVTETFDLPRIYLMGRRARFFTYSGTLANTENLQWKNRFLHIYENYLRGSRCVENRARAYLIYDDVIREGIVVNAQTSPNEGMLNAVPFSFTMFIIRTAFIGDRAKIRCPEEDLLVAFQPTQTESSLARVFRGPNVGELSESDRQGIAQELFDPETEDLISFAGVFVGLRGRPDL